MQIYWISFSTEAHILFSLSLLRNIFFILYLLKLIS